MDIRLRPELLKLLREKNMNDSRDYVQRLANDLIFLYLQGDLIRPAQIVGRVKIPTVYRKESETFDAQTHAFAGVVVGESLWVPSMELRDMLEENTEVLVLKSPRKAGIRRKRGKRRTSRTQ